ncbi:PREDICTED: uncharacterized protein LOC109152979 [Ipomoea nil]|uniref:uncharacterized protein LOC109152979 n=1 Tax=Ipomoea nil TaxID=35883 RepID=UPI000901CF07|nr:PREDICTED: uncharacterized protein LOC109152979 [Ipomoea nil]
MDVYWRFPQFGGFGDGEMRKSSTMGATYPHLKQGGLQSKDENGNWVVGFTANIENCSIAEAEAWSIFKGLKLAWKKGCRKVVVESDAKNIIDCLNHHDSEDIYLMDRQLISSMAVNDGVGRCDKLNLFMSSWSKIVRRISWRNKLWLRDGV